MRLCTEIVSIMIWRMIMMANSVIKVLTNTNDQQYPKDLVKALADQNMDEHVQNVVNMHNNVTSGNILEYTPESKIKAFEDDGIYSDLSVDEMKKRLGKENVSLERHEQDVAIDMITGERFENTGAIEPESIDSIKALDITSSIKELNEMERQRIRILLLPPEYADSQVDAFINMIESKLQEVSYTDIDKMTTDGMKDFIGSELFSYVGRIDKHPLSSLKSFLSDSKRALREKVKVIAAMDEANAAMQFLVSDIPGIKEKIVEQLGDDFETDLHKLQTYMQQYKLMLQTKNSSSNSFINDEIKSVDEKLAALCDTLSFTTLTAQLPNIKSDIHEKLKDHDFIRDYISNFIGFLNADDSMKINFPVPKEYKVVGRKETSSLLTTVWMVYLQMIVAYEVFPALQDMGPYHFSILSQFVIGTKVVPEDERTEVDKMILQIIKDNDITLDKYNKITAISTTFTYVLARIFRPSKLNAHKKYVLSYIMAILTTLTDKRYIKFSHKMIAAVIDILY